MTLLLGGIFPAFSHLQRWDKAELEKATSVIPTLYALVHALALAVEAKEAALLHRDARIARLSRYGYCCACENANMARTALVCMWPVSVSGVICCVIYNLSTMHMAYKLLNSASSSFFGAPPRSDWVFILY